jgi:hypothetical protein
MSIHGSPSRSPRYGGNQATCLYERWAVNSAQHGQYLQYVPQPVTQSAKKKWARSCGISFEPLVNLNFNEGDADCQTTWRTSRLIHLVYTRKREPSSSQSTQLKSGHPLINYYTHFTLNKRSNLRSIDII